MTVQFQPTDKAIQNATRAAFKGSVDEAHLAEFLRSTSSNKVPAPLVAQAKMAMIGIFGGLECKPEGQPWKFNAKLWGGGVASIAAGGMMYTAYDSWEAFFTETRGFHVQGITDLGGVLQINWFDGKGRPCGQFNGVAGGVAVFQAGGKAKWKRTKK